MGLALSPLAALAKTDLAGCTSFTSMVTVRTEIGYGNTYQTVIWFMTDNLEICEGVDCGGGRAPPKTVPGCPAYTGTETVTPKFLGSNPFAPPAQTTSVATQTTARAQASDVTTSPTRSGAGAGAAVTSTTATPAAAPPVATAAAALNMALGVAAAVALL
jgi:hypothetical protein